MKTAARLSLDEARALAVSAQGLHGPRPAGTVTRAQVLKTIARLGVIQLDAINVLARTQFLALFSRLGPYDPSLLHRLSGPGGELLEYWAHAASLVPMGMHPLFRHRMEIYATDPTVTGARRQAWAAANASYLAAVRDEVRERGPLSAAQLSDPRRRQAEWWERRSDGRRALEWLFARGELAAWRSPSFERVYDVPERVIPPAVLGAPTPRPDQAREELVLKAAASLGVATLKDLAHYYAMRLDQTRARVARLVADGRLVEVSVEGWKEPAYCRPGARPGRVARPGATLLSPFDSLVWQRDRNRRLFGFDYRIEVYVPGPRRVFGYFVLPLLLGDRLVGRFDLKADRRARVLRVQSSHVEPGQDKAEVAAAAAAELDRMRRWLGLDDVAVVRRGNLAPALEAAVRSLAN